MNIFQLSETGDPIEAAQMHCDLHCNKMLLEQIQLLTNCIPSQNLSEMPLTQKNEVRSYSHFNHPSAKWVRMSRQNVCWSLQHAIALEEERLNRNFNPHFSSTCLQWIEYNIHRFIDNFPDIGLTPFSVAIGADKECRARIRNFDDLPVYQQYRHYYVFDKPFAKWDRLQNTPPWFTELKQKYRLV